MAQKRWVAGLATSMSNVALGLAACAILAQAISLFGTLERVYIAQPLSVHLVLLTGLLGFVGLALTWASPSAPARKKSIVAIIFFIAALLALPLFASTM